MKRLLIAAIILMPTLVMAQVPELNLKVTQAEAELIWKGLRKLPVEEVEVVMAKLRSQVNEQTAPKLEPKVEQKKD